MSPRRSPLRFHAIYAVLNDAALFECSVRSIYEHVSGITVVTTRDRDWRGDPIEPDDLIDRILSRSFDPDRKVELIISTLVNEAHARNQAMDAAGRGVHRPRSGPIRRPAGRVSDYFWIVDADEVYEREAIESLQAFVAHRRRPVYRVAFRTYFKTWNYRVRSVGWATTFLRTDRRLVAIRNPRTSLLAKIAYRMPGVPYEAVHRVGGSVQIPHSVGLFHHGSYVGGDDRVLRKVEAGGHSEHMLPGWIDEVWRPWTPESRDMHPTDPHAFPAVDYVPTEELPVEISGFDWPSGYLGFVESGKAVTG